MLAISRLMLAAIVIISVSSCALIRKVRPQDLEAWRGVPIADLEIHPEFSAMPLEKRELSNGGELWIFTNKRRGTTPINCSHSKWGTDCAGGQAYEIRCSHQFFVRNNKVLHYRPIGRCYTDCRLRPASRPCN